MVRNWRKSALVLQRPEIADLVDVASANEETAIRRLLEQHPSLVTEPFAFAATKESASEYFIDELAHYIYAGDTAMHMAAMSYCSSAIALLIENGANVHATNRRGAQPLHYAADGSPNLDSWNPDRQQATVEALISAGAAVDAVDKSGVAPLHRAVRQRCTGAVRALLAAGANVNLKNASGSTPLQLARLTTGKSGSGTTASKKEQTLIIDLLLARK